MAVMIEELDEGGDAPAPAPAPPPPLPTSERPATREDLERKRRNGHRYIQDVWLVVAEFPTANIYECKSGTDLALLWKSVGPALLFHDVLSIDSSKRLDNLFHAVHLTEAYTELVREARAEKVCHVLRRTPTNSGAMLMLQRLQHVAGNVDEMSPVALIVLVGDEELLLERDRVPDHDALCALVMEMVTCRSERRREQLKVKLKTGEKDMAVAPVEIQAMPKHRFEEQMAALNELAAKLEVVRPPSLEELEAAAEEEDLAHFLKHELRVSEKK